jgi:hypothetical protein
VPTSLTKLDQAVKRAHSAYEKAERAQRERQAPVKAASVEEPGAA